MSDELAAIRERHERIARKDKWSTPRMVFVDLQETHVDRRTLLALLDAEREARASAEASVAALRGVIEAEVASLSRAGWPHEYPDGYHKMPGCYGCQLLGRLSALLADTRAAAEAHDAAIRREAVAQDRKRIRAVLDASARCYEGEPLEGHVVSANLVLTMLAEPSDA